MVGDDPVRLTAIEAAVLPRTARDAMGQVPTIPPTPLPDAIAPSLFAITLILSALPGVPPGVCSLEYRVVKSRRSSL